ncbi:MAG: histidine kinase dimerization/phosphoacceptor domain -containing protein [Ekhidna sp.]
MSQSENQKNSIQKELDFQNQNLNDLNTALNEAQRLSHIGSWHWDMSTDEAEWSDEMYHIYGVTKEGFYPSNENVTKTVFPEDLHKVEQGIGALLMNKIFKPFEFRIKRPSGEIRNLYILALEKGAAGTEKENMIFGVTQDITERKQSQRAIHHLAQIASNSTDMIFLIDGKYEYQAANAAYLNAYNLSSDQLINRKIIDVVDEPYFNNVVKPNIKKCLNGETVNYQTWFEFPSIGRKYMDVKYSQYLNDEGDLAGVAVTASDVTLRKHAEDKIIRSLEEKELLLRELYHRTKNNMQVISSMLSIKSLYTDNVEVKEMLDETKSKILGMALVHEKLYQANDLSRIDLKDYISDLVELLKNSLLPKVNNLKIATHLQSTKTNIDTAIPCGLIINELFTNAIKHGFPNDEQGTIKIELINNGSDICISVSDTGVGIPKEVDFKNSNTYGLQAVVMLAEIQLGGSISLINENGTEFTLRFKEAPKTDRI